LNDARQLSEEDHLLLIDSLWETVPANANLPLNEAWASELERRVAAIQAGKVETVPWEAIRAEAVFPVQCKLPYDRRPHAAQ
jgi:putative addiction module component (TIGR02574 family)